MREILFRGKQTDGGAWVEGYVVETTVFGVNRCRNAIVIYKKPEKIFDSDWWEVNPETIGQYTGLIDRNGKKVFEGDIISSKGKVYGKTEKFLYVIKYGQYIPKTYCREIYQECETIGFYGESKGQQQVQLGNYPQKIEVIGNVYDNPELLEGDQLYGLQ